MKRYGVTTVDNPFNPITEFDNWYIYDVQKGYGTCERLAARCLFSDAMSDQEQQEQISLAIDAMITEKAFDKYNNMVELKKVEVDD